MARWRNTIFTEVPNESPQEKWGVDETQSTRTLDIGWGPDADPNAGGRQQAARDFLGYSTVASGLAGGLYVSRIIPHAHPDFLRPDNQTPFLFAESMECVGRGQPINALTLNTTGNLKSTRDTILYDTARCRVMYATRPYDIIADNQVQTRDADGNPDESGLERYVEILARPSGSYLNIPTGRFKYVGGGIVPGSPGKIEPETDLILKWWFVPRLCVGTKIFNPTLANPPIEGGLGKFNGASIWGCDPGTLLFESVEIEPHIDPFGQRICHVTYHFKWNPNTHYKLLQLKSDGSAGSYIEVTTDGTSYSLTVAGRHIYDAASPGFQALFRVPN